ncbi:hypothetical protein [Dyadobacter diqingensis]|uniref:hypothetical protein n=1 Tax=Dyadobacter diqingensis TaxID=2938121 RepID=UPI0020C18FD4|nr:hypothetical protein [Dyadobacter diqingensis]
MAINPKIEFFRFTLKHKKEQTATFKDFVIEELGGRPTQSDNTLFTRLFKYFEDSLTGEHARDEKLKTIIKVAKKKNLYIKKKPIADISKFIISGVINGGPYGRYRILGDTQNEEDENELGTNKIVYLYYYIFLYCPLDHNEGFFGIHSNSSQESVTQLFRNFVAKIFSGKHFYNSPISIFAPKSFQDDFKKDSLIQSIVFEETFINPDFNSRTDGESSIPPSYDIKIVATPKKGWIPAAAADALKAFFAAMSFGEPENQKELREFDSKLTTRKEGSNKTKTFQWADRDKTFTPVIYLEDYITKFNPDDTPDFDALNSYIHSLFENEILNEIRPDKNATKSD